MRRICIKYLLILALPFLIVSCGSETTPSGPVKAMPKMPVAKKPPAKPKKKAVVRRPVKIGPDGKEIKEVMRNPFKSFLFAQDTDEEAGRVRGPLECCELGVFRLMAIISGINNPKALIVAPDGQKYIIKKGDLIGLREGKISKIYGNKVIIEEKAIGASYGKESDKEFIELTLPSVDSKSKKKRK